MDGVTIARATEAQKPVVAQLIQLYLYDMTEHLPFPVGDNGLFQYDFLERFWQHPYLVRVGEEVAGFALVIDECPITGDKPCWFMAEFFVLKAYRGRGVGAAAVSKIIARHPGKWHVATTEQNTPAVAFWRKVLVDRTIGPPEHRRFDGDDWIVHAFEEPTAGPVAE